MTASGGDANGSADYDEYNQSQFNDTLSKTPLASNGQRGYIVNGNRVPGSQCGEK